MKELTIAYAADGRPGKGKQVLRHNGRPVKQLRNAEGVVVDSIYVDESREAPPPPENFSDEDRTKTSDKRLGREVGESGLDRSVPRGDRD